MKRIRTSHATNRGFTLTELLTVIAIIAILAAILIPLAGRARAAAHQTSCMSNLRQLGTATLHYAADHRQALPFGYWNEKDTGKNVVWDIVLLPYFAGAQESVLLCPADDLPVPPSSKRRTYSMVRAGSGGVGRTGFQTANAPEPVRTLWIPQPAKTLMFAEYSSALQTGQTSDNRIGSTAGSVIDTPAQQLSSGLGAELHRGRFNYLFADGHVDSLTPDSTVGTGTLQAPRGIWTWAADD